MISAKDVSEVSKEVGKCCELRFAIRNVKFEFPLKKETNNYFSIGVSKCY